MLICLFSLSVGWLVFLFPLLILLGLVVLFLLVLWLPELFLFLFRKKVLFLVWFLLLFLMVRAFMMIVLFRLSIISSPSTLVLKIFLFFHHLPGFRHHIFFLGNSLFIYHILNVVSRVSGRNESDLNGFLKSICVHFLWFGLRSLQFDAKKGGFFGDFKPVLVGVVFVIGSVDFVIFLGFQPVNLI